MTVAEECSNQRIPPLPPLPPLPEKIDGRHTRRAALSLVFAAAAVFAVAAFLNPYEDSGQSRTHGTHHQLGLPPCTFKKVFGIGCPSCGMTTTFSLLMHGDLSAALRTNWAGVLIALLVVADAIWFSLLALGVRPRTFTVENVVAKTAIIGTCIALFRWSMSLGSFFL